MSPVNVTVEAVLLHEVGEKVLINIAGIGGVIVPRSEIRVRDVEAEIPKHTMEDVNRAIAEGMVTGTYPPLSTRNNPCQECQEENKKLQKDIDAMKSRALNFFAAQCHLANHKWWHDLNTGLPIERNKGELIALMHSELSEALEGTRKSSMDRHLPHRRSEEVELVDCLIRIFDYAAAYRLDLDGAFKEKMQYNATRQDHTHEARRAEGGKKF